MKTTLCLVLIAASFFVMADHRKMDSLKSRLAKAQAESDQNAGLLQSAIASGEGWKSKMEDATLSLSNAVFALKQSKELIADYQKRIAALELADSKESARQKLMDEVPAIQSGSAIVFPLVLSTLKTALATNAEFVRLFGRRLTFKSGLTLQAFDVDELHPGILLRLNVDPARAKEYQVKMDAAKRAWAVAQQQQTRQNLQSESQRLAQITAQQEQLAAQQAKEAEAARRVQFDENLRQQAANNDSIRARAALIQSLNPY